MSPSILAYSFLCSSPEGLLSSVTQEVYFFKQYNNTEYDMYNVD